VDCLERRPVASGRPDSNEFRHIDGGVAQQTHLLPFLPMATFFTGALAAMRALPTSRGAAVRTIHVSVGSVAANPKTTGPLSEAIVSLVGGTTVHVLHRRPRVRATHPSA
jgi:hypothetical protein